MANLFLESKAKGDWWYEILEGKTKIQHRIKFGFNEIPESHIETLENDPGYKAKLGKLYKVLKKNEALIADKKDTKAIDAAKELKEAKTLYNAKVAELKKELETQLKKDKEEWKAKLQQLTDSRGEALRKVKDLEAEKVKLAGELAGFEAESKKALEIAKSEFDEYVIESKKELEDLKLSSEKKVKGLEGEKTALEKQVENLKAKPKAK